MPGMTDNFFIVLSERIQATLFSLGRYVEKVYYGSRTYKITVGFHEGIKISFKQSFFKETVGIVDEINFITAMEKSGLICMLLKIYTSLKKMWSNCLKISFAINYVKGLKGRYDFLSVRSLSAFILIGTLLNISCYVWFDDFRGNEILLTGWIIRGAFLFVGLAGLYCKAGIREIANTSLFLKLLVSHHK